MTGSILAGFDPHRPDTAPVAFGAAVARFTGAPLVVAHLGRGSTKEAMAALVDAGVEAEWRELSGNSAARALHEEAERDEAALLVVGASHRSRFGRAVVGSTGMRLLHGSPCPVGVVPSGWKPKGQLDSVGVGYVDSDEGRGALASAHAIARATGATLKIFSVFTMHAGTHLEAQARQTSWQYEVTDMTDVEGGHVAVLEEHLRQVAADLGDDVAVETEALSGHPAEEIQRLSALVDLMVVGSRGYGPSRAVLLGSVSRRLVEDAQSPAIVVPRGEESVLDRLLADAPQNRAARH